MLLLSLFDLSSKLGSIIFLRHGQAENNTRRILAGRAGGVPLTDTGRDQAQKAAEFLEHLNVSAIYSSPIERARSTAEIVARHNSLDVTFDERLIELEMGDFTGMRYDDIFSNHGNVFLKFYEGSKEIAENGIETFDQVKSRVGNIVSHVLKEHPDQNIVLVTHMDPIKAMLSAVIDPSPKTLFEMIIANASLNIFRENNSKFSLSAINLMHPSRFDQAW